MMSHPPMNDEKGRWMWNAIAPIQERFSHFYSWSDGGLINYVAPRIIGFTAGR